MSASDKTEEKDAITWIHVLARASLVNTFSLGTKEKYSNENKRSWLSKSSMLGKISMETPQR